MEITAGWNLTRSIALSADYAYIKALEGDGSPRLRVPRHSGDLMLSFDPPGGLPVPPWSASMAGRAFRAAANSMNGHVLTSMPGMTCPAA